MPNDGLSANDGKSFHIRRGGQGSLLERCQSEDVNIVIAVSHVGPDNFVAGDRKSLRQKQSVFEYSSAVVLEIVGDNGATVIRSFVTKSFPNDPIPG